MNLLRGIIISISIILLTGCSPGKTNKDTTTNNEMITLNNQYQELVSENEALKKQNQDLITELEEAENQVKELNNKTTELPENNSVNNNTSAKDPDVINDLTTFLSLLMAGNFSNAKEYMGYYTDIEDEVGQVLNGYLLTMFSGLEGITVYKSSMNDTDYIIRDYKGNEISFYYRAADKKFYSILVAAKWADSKSKEFVNALKNEDLELLRNEMIEDDLCPSDEEIVYVIEEYKKIFDLETIENSFIGMDLDGYVYRITGEKNGVEASDIFHINFSSDIVYIADYRGRTEWTGHMTYNFITGR